MTWWTCRGCEAKDMEIARLADQNRTLLDRLMVSSGKPEATTAALGGEEQEPAPAEPEKPYDEQAEKALRALATERGVDPLEYADA